MEQRQEECREQRPSQCRRLAVLTAAHPDKSTGFRTEQREIDPERTEGEVWIAFRPC